MTHFVFLVLSAVKMSSSVFGESVHAFVSKKPPSLIDTFLEVALMTGNFDCATID
jgi:hypothetical protein